MKPFAKYLDVLNDEKVLLKEALIWVGIAILALVYLHISGNMELAETSEAFKNSEVLVCYETLIVSDSNWKLVDNHLINNNSAGYILIDNCKIKKD